MLVASIWVFLLMDVVSAQVADEDLVFVQILFRHGDRTPLGFYPQDPYLNQSFWKQGYGQIVDAGKLRHFKFGKWLRNRYKNFLPEKYDHNDVYVRSSDYDRCIISALSNLAGLYLPTSETDKFEGTIEWQPIPVHTVPRNQDNVIALGKPCRVKDSEVMKQQNQLYSFLNKTANISVKNTMKEKGLNITDITFVLLNDVLSIEKDLNYELPNWTNAIYPQPMESIVDELFNYLASNTSTIQRRLTIGPLFNLVIQNIRNIMEGSSSLKLMIYSGHDTTVACVLATLGYSEGQPPFASSVIMETYKSNGTYFLKIFYRPSEEIMKTLIIPGCQEFCPVEKFIEIMQPIIPDNWDYECSLTNEIHSYHVYELNSLGIILLIIVILSFLILLLVILWMHLRTKRLKRSFILENSKQNLTTSF